MKAEAFGAKMQAQPFSTRREQLMSDILHVALANSQKRTPWRHGTLRRSETTRMEDAGARGYVGTNVKYGPFVHDGTKNRDGSVRMAARPFFAEGIENSRPQVERLAEKAGNRYFKDLTS